MLGFYAVSEYAVSEFPTDSGITYTPGEAGLIIHTTLTQVVFEVTLQ